MNNDVKVSQMSMGSEGECLRRPSNDPVRRRTIFNSQGGSRDDDSRSTTEEEELMVDKTTLAGNVPVIRRIAVTVPRLYYVTMNVLIPMIILILISFLFGYLLALVESTGEKWQNDEAVRKSYLDYVQYELERIEFHKVASDTAGTCWKQHYEKIAFWSSDFPDMAMSNASECALAAYSSEQDPASYLLGPRGPSVLSFDWITCPRSNVLTGALAKMDQFSQHIKYIETFYGSFVYHQATYMSFGNMTHEEAANAALTSASGAANCNIHFAGGALFWFTVMTTIGWGNAYPSTYAGKMLVYVFGFISIIAFAALISSAGHVIATIVDDIFLRRGMIYMTRGLPAIFFWLSSIIGWILILALWGMHFARTRIGVATPLKDTFWLSYITLTSVGLGDMYIAHEEFTPLDMFSIPFLCLIGFTAVTTFGVKLRDAMLVWFPTDQTLELLLESRREKIDLIEKTSAKKEAFTTERTSWFGMDADMSVSNTSPTMRFVLSLKALDDFDLGKGACQVSEDGSHKC